MLKATKNNAALGLGNIMNGNNAMNERQKAKVVDGKAWKDIQKKTFTNWSTYQIKKKESDSGGVKNIYSDLNDGEQLMRILEGCMDKPYPGTKMKKAKMKIQKIENITRGFKFMAENDVKLVNIGPEDVHDGNEKLILGLIWTLIAKFTISVLATDGTKGSAKEILLFWLNSQLNGDDTITDFGNCLSDGKLLTKLVNSAGKTVYGDGTTLIEDNDRLSADERTTIAMDTAEEKLCVPQLVAPVDMYGNVHDEHSTMAYLALFKSAKKPAPQPKKVSMQEEPDVDEATEDAMLYGQTTRFENGGTGLDNLTTHRRESKDIYAVPPNMNKGHSRANDDADDDGQVDENENDDLYAAPSVLGGKTAMPTAPLDAPTATALSSTSIQVSWKKPATSVDVYTVYRDDEQIHSSKELSFTDTGLKAGTTYTYSYMADKTLSSPAQGTTTKPKSGGGAVAAMIAKAKADQAEKDALSAKVNQKKTQNFRFQVTKSNESTNAYLDVSPNAANNDDNDGSYKDVDGCGSYKDDNDGSYQDVDGCGSYNDDDDGSYKDVCPTDTNKVQYVTVKHDEVDDSSYKDVCPNEEEKPAEKKDDKVQYTRIRPSQRKAATETQQDKSELPPPCERAADWRDYKGENLGGRCKIRVYFSTTTSDSTIRANTQSLQSLMERFKVHQRPDFEPWIPVDMDMERDFRNKIFEKASTRKTPLLFVDDEFVGGWDHINDLMENDMQAVEQMFKY